MTNQLRLDKSLFPDTLEYFFQDTQEPSGALFEPTLAALVQAYKAKLSLYPNLGMVPSNHPELAEIENQIKDYLHRNPLTPEDFALLLPDFQWFFEITKKIATNIGLWASRGFISDSEVEEYLQWMLLEGDRKYTLFERTKNQIGRFRKERDERKANGGRRPQVDKSLPGQMTKLGLNETSNNVVIMYPREETEVTFRAEVTPRGSGPYQCIIVKDALGVTHCYTPDDDNPNIHPEPPPQEYTYDDAFPQLGKSAASLACNPPPEGRKQHTKVWLQRHAHNERKKAERQARRVEKEKKAAEEAANS